MFKLQLKDNPARSIWLVGEKVTLGSDASNTMVLDGLGIEEFHAELVIEPNHLTLKSKPGTCVVNDLPVDGEHILRANDELRIGRERLLIIDPKNPPKPKPARKPSAAKAEAQWKLIPDHAKLDNLDFSIRDRAVLGRAKECAFCVPYKLLSREHAELWIENDALYVKDLESANGCFVNGKRVREAQLRKGDKLAFAKLSFTVEGPEDSAAAGAGEDELNRTQIRPAIQFDEALLGAGAESGGDSLSLEMDSGENASASGDEAGKSGGKGSMIAVVLVIVIAAAAGGWFFLQGQ